MIGGIAGSTKQPLVAFPITGSQVYVAAGLAAFTAADRVDDHLADPRTAEVAGEHGVTRRQHATLLDPGHHRAYVVRRQQRPAPGAVPGVVGEHDREHRPHLVPQPLQRERGGGVADVAVRDERLDRQEAHLPILPVERRPLACGT